MAPNFVTNIYIVRKVYGRICSYFLLEIDGQYELSYNDTRGQRINESQKDMKIAVMGLLP